MCGEIDDRPGVQRHLRVVKRNSFAAEFDLAGFPAIFRDSAGEVEHGVSESVAADAVPAAGGVVPEAERRVVVRDGRDGSVSFIGFAYKGRVVVGIGARFAETGCKYKKKRKNRK